MKKIILIIIAFFAGLALATAQKQENTKAASKPESALQFAQTVADLGKIPQGVPAIATYEFTNTGDKPVVITNVRTSCGCTDKKYPKKPINPGGKAKVQATYNAAKVGSFHKTITVRTNENAMPKILRIKGVVVKKEEEEK